MKNITALKDYKKIIKTLLTPNLQCESVQDISLSSIYNKGYRVLILDVDNTILKTSERYLTLHAQNWVAKAQSTGFRVFLVSNNSSKSRIKRVFDQLKVEGLYFAIKPFIYSAKEFLNDRFIDSNKCVFIGDQLLTDVLIGNWLKSLTVLVDPLDKKLSFIKTVQKEVEGFLLEKISKL
jgi:uncharacterized protein